ncbi:hypothetical protein [Streptomyces sp. NBC_00316]|uniref:hypothetical protein n=1 Tax=Streptomyces sp. NBC_00316 TaxID=2975710 RepID=UPI002E2E3988|nr:hypothetical protein [Streptomyces sp. NBC_00316]
MLGFVGDVGDLARLAAAAEGARLIPNWPRGSGRGRRSMNSIGVVGLLASGKGMPT